MLELGTHLAMAAGMLAKVLCWLVVVSACDSGSDKLAFYDQAESGSTWQLDFGAGSPTGETAFMGTCPTFVSRTIALPNEGMPCGATCSCTLDLSVGDQDGAFSESEYLLLEFAESCNDNTGVSTDANLEASMTNDVRAYGDTSDSPNDGLHDCFYPLHLTVTFAP